LDIFAKAYDYQVPRQAAAAGLYPYFIPLSSGSGPEAVMAGRRVLMFGSNDYLGLTGHPEVKQAAVRALEAYGTSCTGSRLVNGTIDLHLELEEAVAGFFRRPAALVFTTGYQAALGTISSLTGLGDTVLADRGVHASLLEGARLGHGRVLRFRHNDLGQLEQMLASGQARGGTLIVTDGVFSMHGDLAPLGDLIRLKNAYGARLVVDDAHGIGVLGGHGRGTAEHLGAEDGVDLLIGTFSKSLAATGGFVTGPAEVVDYIRHHARAMIFSAAMPAPSAAAALAALRIVQAQPGPRARLRRAVLALRDGLRSAGFPAGDAEAAIVPIEVGAEIETLRLWRRLFDEGFYANPAIPPAVEPGRSLLRASCTADHTSEHIREAVGMFRRVASGTSAAPVVLEQEGAL
jgi:8-amino-7-oxononanoate synthase